MHMFSEPESWLGLRSAEAVEDELAAFPAPDGQASHAESKRGGESRTPPFAVVRRRVIALFRRPGA